MPTQPQLTGNDGYGRLKSATSGVAMRHNVRIIDPSWDGVTTVPGEPQGIPRILVPAVHQVNTTETNPVLYTPRESSIITPGQTYRFSYAVSAYSAVKAAGENHFRVSVDWYTNETDPALRTYLGHQDGPWFSELDFFYANEQRSIRVSGDFVAPANAYRAHPTAEFQCPSPVNSWAIYDVRYEQAPFAEEIVTRPTVTGVAFDCNYVVDWMDGKPYRTRYTVVMDTTDLIFYDPDTSSMIRLDSKPWRLESISVDKGSDDLVPVTAAPYSWEYSTTGIYSVRAYFNFDFSNVTNTYSIDVNREEWDAVSEAAVAEWQTQNPTLTWDPADDWWHAPSGNG